jgi:hypothetical protein
VKIEEERLIEQGLMAGEEIQPAAAVEPAAEIPASPGYVREAIFAGSRDSLESTFSFGTGEGASQGEGPALGTSFFASGGETLLDEKLPEADDDREKTERNGDHYDTPKTVQMTAPDQDYDPSDPFAFMGGGAGTGEFSGSAAAPSGMPVMFQVDRSLDRIEYRDSKEIITIHRSLNFARITPDGKFPENSSAFICAMDVGGEKKIYVPFLLTDSGKVLVYVPDRQPKGNDELQSIVAEALFFAETVGFIMEEMSLPKAGESRNSLLTTVPVFKRVSD